VIRASLLRGRAAARRAIKVEELFDQYLDHVMDLIVRLGVDPPVAMDVIFETATYLSEQRVLPIFPGSRARSDRVGAWILAAGAFDFATFVERSVVES
jgi:hypothetical protein